LKVESRIKTAFANVRVEERGGKLRIALLALIFVVGCGPKVESTKSEPTKPVASTETAKARELSVAAASDLKFVLTDIIADFEKENPNVQVKATFGASGSFFAQLSNQAPFDLFLSADISYPQKLADAGLADKQSLFSYATGQIAVWVPKESGLNIDSRGIEILKDPSIQKIAIANPMHAPYGRAAESALKHFGLYDELSDRLVLGENVAQAAQFVDTGAAQAGIIAFSLIMAPPMRDKGLYWIVPKSAYPPLEQGGVIVNWAREPKLAEQFRDFLLTDRSREIFDRYGFTVPEKQVIKNLETD
jgi:molybdate transport system substrate-binding protein